MAGTFDRYADLRNEVPGAYQSLLYCIITKQINDSCNGTHWHHAPFFHLLYALGGSVCLCTFSHVGAYHDMKSNPRRDHSGINRIHSGQCLFQ